MNIAIWLAQSFLLSIAIFFLLGEEYVLDRQGDSTCLKVTPVSTENSSDRWIRNPKCCKMKKTAKWQVLFGVLSVAHTIFLSLFYSLRNRSKSPLAFLSVVCAICWALTSIVLLTKLVAHLSPQTSGTQRTASRSSYASTLFVFARNTLMSVLMAAFQRIVRILTNSKHSVSISESERAIFLKQELQDGLYFCSSELNSPSLEQAGIDVSRAMVALIMAYFISSGYTLYLVLTNVKCDGEIFKPLSQSTGILAQSVDGINDRGCDRLDAGEVSEGHMRSEPVINKKCAAHNGLREFSKKDMIVAFMEEESDEESFVFGWRL